MPTINRSDLLIQKPSGNYSCPHFIPPDTAGQIAESASVSLDQDAKKALAEIAENFALQLLKSSNRERLSESELRSLVSRITLA